LLCRVQAKFYAIVDNLHFLLKAAEDSDYEMKIMSVKEYMNIEG